MNFVRLYIGDYLRDTGTLTVAEHGAYMLMLMHYYATEKPLPTGRELHRLLRAESKAERDAIDSIARRFWTDSESGLVNARADREIGRADHQRTVNRATGRLGGRPKRTETESVTESVTEPEPKPKRSRTEGKANNNPNQTPDTIHNPPSPSGMSPPCPDDVDSGTWADWLALRKAKKAPVTATVLSAARAEAEKAGMLLQAFLQVWCIRGTQGMQAEWLRPNGARAGGDAEPEWRREQRERNESFAGPFAAKRRPQLTPEIIDVEAKDGIARIVG